MLTLLILKSFASPYSRSTLHPRQAESTVEPPVAGISATITSPNGTDISSAFQTLLYQSPTIVASSNLTDRDLVHRQSPGLVHPIDFCRRRSATFVLSECDPNSTRSHPLGCYKVRCRLLNRPFDRNPFMGEHVRIPFLPNSNTSRTSSVIR